MAALGYLTNGPILDGLIEIENLTLVILWDEVIRPGCCALRVAGYSGSRIPWGVRFGGTDNRRFCKDLFLQPVAGAQGFRMDLDDPELLVLGMKLHRDLDRSMRHPRRRLHAHVQLPKLWAAFRPADAANITGDGPELAAYAARTGRPPHELLHACGAIATD